MASNLRASIPEVFCSDEIFCPLVCDCNGADAMEMLQKIASVVRVRISVRGGLLSVINDDYFDRAFRCNQTQSKLVLKRCEY